MARALQNLRHRTVVITGASAGVGRATALRFASAGAQIALIARDAKALNEVKEEVERRGGSAIVLPLDVADAEAVIRAADQIEMTAGAIDIWINDAMVTVFSPVWRITPAEFRRVTEVTYLGVVHGTMAALRHMRPRNRGTIVNVGSALAYRGIPLQAAYCGAKFAVRGFTDSLRSELLHARSNIALTVVELPAVNTPQFDWARTHMPHQPRPVAPVVQPEVIAGVIFRAALNPRREFWIGMATMKAILATMIVPEYLDRYLAKNTYDQQETKVPVSATRKDNLMNPVEGLHRTRGRFSNEAADSALTLPGPIARLLPLFAAAVGGFSVGLLIGHGLERKHLRKPAPSLSRARSGLLR
jgi:NAD(P)-dependent dehydrogenase (short-subunit alcohol dehydrogenase family)